MAVSAMDLGAKMGRAMGAGFIYTLATMRNDVCIRAFSTWHGRVVRFLPDRT
jgi:hypothetical protein